MEQKRLGGKKESIKTVKKNKEENKYYLKNNIYK